MEAELKSIYFKGDYMFKHNIMRINYTTYDVRRSQDTINPRTDHRDIMLISQQCMADDDHDEQDHGAETGYPSGHQYIYGRVLGIYHVNVIYVPPRGPRDYRPRRIDFLWVRWFKPVKESVQRGWAAARLDQLEFLPLREDSSFGFVDPSQVLRACHIIPRFASGKRYRDGIGLSTCAQDAEDWHAYYANRYVEFMYLTSNTVNKFDAGRFVDRDTVMRYHWGLGVGHVGAVGLSAYRHQFRSSRIGKEADRSNNAGAEANSNVSDGNVSNGLNTHVPNSANTDNNRSTAQDDRWQSLPEHNTEDQNELDDLEGWDTVSILGASASDEGLQDMDDSQLRIALEEDDMYGQVLHDFNDSNYD
jgi:hypothetical protein